MIELFKVGLSWVAPVNLEQKIVALFYDFNDHGILDGLKWYKN